jgi:hypothetical protein
VRVLSIACVIAISLPRAASADGVGVIAIGGERATVAQAMAQAIDGKRRVVEDAVEQAKAAIALGAVPISELQRFRRVREEIDEGWRAYLRVQFDFAQSRLAVARTDAEGLVALPGGAALYADAALKLGAVLAHIGRAQESQELIALAIALDPDRPITLAEFSPDVVAAFDAARSLTPPLQHVRVAVEPPGAIVSIDGKEVGHAPIEAEVPRGQHVVVAQLPLFRARALGIVVDEQASDIKLDLERDEAAATLATGGALGMPDAATQVLVDATLRFADLDELVLVAAVERRGAPAMLVQRCVGEPTRCGAIVEVGYGDRSAIALAAREALAAARAGELRYTPSLFGDPRVLGKQPPHHCELCRSPWLWGGVSAAAVVGTIVVLAIVTASRPPPIVSADPTSFTHPQ